MSEFKVNDKRHSAAKEEKIEKPKSGEGFTMKEGAQEEASPPMQVDFSTLVLSLYTGAMIQLGAIPDPSTNKREINLPLAQQNIEILALLQNKTKGNLGADEHAQLEKALTDLRLLFVKASKK